MQRILTLFILLAALTSQSALASKSISDSLVTDLPCNKITASEIYKRMSPRQFSSDFHLPTTNWEYNVKSGLYQLGVCWSLSRAQRLFFYLGRWNAPSEYARPHTLQVLNMLRGSSVYPIMQNQESYPRQDFGILAALMRGVGDRDFKTEIEKYETDRFHKLAKNLKLIIGSGSRSKKNNQQSKGLLIQNLQLNKMSLIVIRASRVAQHVVLVKRYQREQNGDVKFWVYDSNRPGHDALLTYRQADSRYYAPGIVYGIVPEKDLHDPVGVYIVDEKERDPVEATLVRHYSSLCSSLSRK
ncbi:hypothetical protein ACLVWU_14765 [Bdellovibrio sp. HCB290]|uniref:hypothetical protein n=1 Tax=Bdellovibrio sp. HCB290 TaxID=3394356 RepID=UPI0039B5BD0F